MTEEELEFCRKIKDRYPNDRDVQNLVDMFDITDTGFQKLDALFEVICRQRDEALAQRDIALARVTGVQ